MRKKRIAIATMLPLVVLFILAIGLRVYDADKTLINDEVVWASTARNLAATGEPLQYVQCNAPVYFYWHPPFGLLAYSAAIGITTDNFTLRLLPIAFGIATIFATYYLGKVLYSRKAGFIAATLMAVSHYHVLYSQNVDVDGGFLAFFNIMAILLFVMHKQSRKSGRARSKKYLYASLGFLALSIFTKLSGFLPIFAMMAYSYAADRKRFRKDAALLLAASALSLVPIAAYAAATGDANYFTGPVSYAAFTALERTGQRTLEQIALNKAFYLSTVTWMLTPFLTAAFLLALARVKRDKNYALLAVWSVFTFLVFFASFNLDIQRYYAVALAPVFILVAKLATSANFSAKHLRAAALAALLTAAAAAALGINDLLGYHNALLLGVFYVAAFLLLLAPLKSYKMPLLLGAFAGLSLYILLSGSSWHALQARTVDTLAANAQSFGFDYREVWGNKDVEYALTPRGEAISYCFPEPDVEFLKSNSVKQISVYHFRDEEGLKSVANSCLRKEEIYINNHLVGITCELAG